MADETKKGSPAAPDLDGVRLVSEDVGKLPVPRAVRELKGERLAPSDASPYDAERGLSAGARRPHSRSPRPAAPLSTREEEARMRRSLPYAARTPEELGAALSRQGAEGVADPQAGKEAGPPLPGEVGLEGDE